MRFVEGADLVLDASLAGLRAASRPLPARRYVSDGTPVYDGCDSLIIAPVSGTQFEGGRYVATIPAVTFAVHLLRCSPGSTPTAMDRAGKSALADADALVDAATHIGCTYVELASVEFPREDGGDLTPIVVTWVLA